MSHKRIHSESQLLAAIDRLNALKASRKAEAERLDKKADEDFKKYVIDGMMECDPKTSGSLSDEDFAMFARQLARAYRWRQRAEKLRAFEPATNKRLKHFGEKLAEFRTGLLPGVTDDPSVVI